MEGEKMKLNYECPGCGKDDWEEFNRFYDFNAVEKITFICNCNHRYTVKALKVENFANKITKNLIDLNPEIKAVINNNLSELLEVEVEKSEYQKGKGCGHPGCLQHVTHPCEKCGRIAGGI